MSAPSPEEILRKYVKSQKIFTAYYDSLKALARDLGVPFQQVVADVVAEAERNHLLSINLDILQVFGLSIEEIEEEVAKYPDVMRIEEDNLIILLPAPAPRKKPRKKERREKAPPAMAPPATPARPQPQERERERGIPVMPETTRTAVKRMKEQAREARLRSEAIAPAPAVVVSEPFGFIPISDLRDIVIRVMRHRATLAGLTGDDNINRFIMQEHQIALELGYLTITGEEWFNVAGATRDDLERFRIGGYLQVQRQRRRATTAGAGGAGVGGGRTGLAEEITVIIPTKKPRPVVWIPARIGESIRNWLLVNREGGSPSEFYQFWRIVRPRTSYSAVVRTFHILETLGLITLKEKKPYTFFNAEYRGESAKLYYIIVPGMEADPRWLHPQSELYPATAVGGKKYARYKAENRIRFGRNPAYR